MKRTRTRIGRAPAAAPLRSLWLALVLALPSSAGAEGASCMLDGREYPENTYVCSGGLQLYCSNGTWQTVDGARCDAPSGSYLGPRRPFEEKSREPVPEFYKEKYPGLPLE